MAGLGAVNLVGESIASLLRTRRTLLAEENRLAPVPPSQDIAHVPLAKLTGTTRELSSAAVTGAAPGRVDSPPMSRRSAPLASSASAWATAASTDANRPPSEKESGVVFTTPMR